MAGFRSLRVVYRDSTGRYRIMQIGCQKAAHWSCVGADRIDKTLLMRKSSVNKSTQVIGFEKAEIWSKKCNIREIQVIFREKSIRKSKILLSGNENCPESTPNKSNLIS
jgi:hypothetical protein